MILRAVDRLRLPLVCLAAWLLWIFTLQEQRLTALTNYVALATAAWLSVALVRRRFQRLPVFASWLAVVFALAIHGRYDTYVERWEKDGITYRDTYPRFGEQTMHRYAFGDDWNVQGSFTASHKKHGPWKTWVPFKSTTEWYWYGEQISEGDWVLRNKFRAKRGAAHH